MMFVPTSDSASIGASPRESVPERTVCQQRLDRRNNSSPNSQIKRFSRFVRGRQIHDH